MHKQLAIRLLFYYEEKTDKKFVLKTFTISFGCLTVELLLLLLLLLPDGVADNDDDHNAGGIILLGYCCTIVHVTPSLLACHHHNFQMEMILGINFAGRNCEEE